MNDLEDFTINLDSTPKGKTWMTGKIVNEDNYQIGNILGDGGLHRKISWMNEDDSLLISSHPKGLWKVRYEIKDHDEDLLGIVKRKSMLGNHMVLQNPSGKNILISKDVKNLPFSFKIMNKEEKVIANMEIKQENTQRNSWKERIQAGYYWKCICTINDKSYDKLLFLGFFISIFGDFISERSGMGGG